MRQKGNFPQWVFPFSGVEGETTRNFYESPLSGCD